MAFNTKLVPNQGPNSRCVLSQLCGSAFETTGLDLGNWGAAANYWMVTLGVMKCEFIVVKCRQIQLKMIPHDTLYVLLGMSIVFLHQMIEVRFASSYQHIKVWTSQRPSGGRNFTTYTRSASLRATFRRSISFEASEDLSWTMTTRVV